MSSGVEDVNACVHNELSASSSPASISRTAGREKADDAILGEEEAGTGGTSSALERELAAAPTSLNASATSPWPISLATSSALTCSPLGSPSRTPT